MLDKIKECICQFVEVDPEEITLESRFVEDLGMNSYDFMSLLGELESELQVTVDEAEVVSLQTVGDAVEYLNKLTGEQEKV